MPVNHSARPDRDFETDRLASTAREIFI